MRTILQFCSFAWWHCFSSIFRLLVIFIYFGLFFFFALVTSVPFHYWVINTLHAIECTSRLSLGQQTTYTHAHFAHDCDGGRCKPKYFLAADRQPLLKCDNISYKKKRNKRAENEKKIADEANREKINKYSSPAHSFVLSLHFFFSIFDVINACAVSSIETIN